MGEKTPNNKICGLLVSIIPENFVSTWRKGFAQKKKVTADYSEKKVTVVG